MSDRRIAGDTGAFEPHDESAAELLRAIFGGGAVVCYAKCVPCQFGQCPGGDHCWADQDDLDHALAIGKPETAEGRCGCPCARGPELEQAPEDYDPVEHLSLDGVPCHLCGEAGACGYDDEGRPYIHASWDEDETEEIR